MSKAKDKSKADAGLMARLRAPVPAASLALFRVVFGTIMLIEVIRFWTSRWIEAVYILPTIHFKYYGFSWVEAWPGNGMYVHFAVLGVAAICIALGFAYRLSALVFFLGYTYVFLIDEAMYRNHFYLVCVLSLMLVFVPAHRGYSIDAWLRGGLRNPYVPAWSVWMIRAQIGFVYFYAGLAKLNADWLHGMPLKMWLARMDVPAPLESLLSATGTAYFLSYAGLAFDLSVTPLLLWRRTRWIGFAGAVGFHLMNSRMFEIGIFPYVMLAATTMFFDPDWPIRLARRLRVAIAVPDFDPGTWKPTPAVVLALAGVLIGLQAVVPLRHYWYPGPAAWNEAGHRFSWRMMLRDKQGVSLFTVVDPASLKTRIVNPETYASHLQIWQLSLFPDLAQQFARWIYEREAAEGRPQVKVNAWTVVSLNGRDYAFLIDPSVDLAATSRTLGSPYWVLPFGEPMEDQARRVWGSRAGPIVQTIRENANLQNAEAPRISP